MRRSLDEAGTQAEAAKPRRPGPRPPLVDPADVGSGALLQAPDSVLTIERLAYTVEEAAMAVGIGRDLIYDEIRTGRLRSKKAGARRIIGRHHLLEWLDGGHLEDHRRAS